VDKSPVRVEIWRDWVLISMGLRAVENQWVREIFSFDFPDFSKR
jgi:hypothetical protein